MTLLLTLLACRAHLVFDAPIADDGTFPRAKPTPAALARYRAAAAYSAARDGRAVMVLEGTSVVFEAYQNDHPAEEPTHLFSGTKSFACAMALAAMEDDLLRLDEPVADTLEEWSDHPEKRRILVADLLHFTSGLEDDFWRLTWDGLLEDPRVTDKYALAIAQPLASHPAEAYDYNSTHLTVFGALLARKTGKDPVDYLDARVLGPLSLRTAGWIRDPAGNPMLAYGAWTTANEWAKYGVLVRDDGVWQGAAILPTGAFATCMQGTEAMPAYGLAFWLNAELTEAQAAEVPHAGVRGGQRLFPSAPADLVIAAGARDNRLYILPSRGLVVVRLGDGSREWRDDAFLALLLE